MNTLVQHKKIILGRANRKEWLFFVDPNDHNEFMSEADGGVLQVCPCLLYIHNNSLILSNLILTGSRTSYKGEIHGRVSGHVWSNDGQG